MNETKQFADIAVVGGGAAGLFAAISAANSLKHHGRIVILEHNARCGKKLLATGNGRCNLLNVYPTLEHFHSEDMPYVKNILARFTPKGILSCFATMGLLCTEERGGLVYPKTMQASSVLDCLRLELNRLAVDEICDFHISAITCEKDGFTLHTKEAPLIARRLILATGGRAAPSFGCDSSGGGFLKAFGHRVTPLFPSLCPIKCKETFLRALKGIRSTGMVRLFADGNLVKEETGEIQFTDTGLSGICIFNLSRMISEFINRRTVSGNRVNSLSVSLDLLPEISLIDIETLLFGLKMRRAAVTLESFLTGILNKRVAQCLLKSLEITPLSRLCDTLRPDEIRRLARTIKDWRFTPCGTAGFEQAQMTAGGAALSQFHQETLESKLRPGLYAAGETLDVDGDCGGYNLYWAWISGKLAGESAAKSL